MTQLPVEPDDCETLGNAVADTNALLHKARSELRTELQKDEPDAERIGELEDDLDDLPRLNDRLKKSLTTACGIAFYPTEEGDPGVDPDELETWHSTIDEMEDDVADSVPERLVEDDISFDEEADLELQKQTFFDHASKTKDAIEDYADDQEFDRDDRNPVGPATIVCKHPEPEKQRECIARRTDGKDVNWAGVSKSGEVHK